MGEGYEIANTHSERVLVYIYLAFGFSLLATLIIHAAKFLGSFLERSRKFSMSTLCRYVCVKEK